MARYRIDDLLEGLEAREVVRVLARRYIQSIEDSVDREIALRMHHDRIGKSATNEDIRRVLALADLQEIEALYGPRVRMAADRGRAQGNHSALRCFLREIRSAIRNRGAAESA
jgi:hypothetical protein